MKITKTEVEFNILLIKQAMNLLDMLLNTEQSYIGFQIEQTSSITLGYDYIIIFPNMNIVVKITDNDVHITQNCKIIYTIPISGNYVAIQARCQQFMIKSTNIKYYSTSKTKKFERR